MAGHSSFTHGARSTSPRNQTKVGQRSTPITFPANNQQAAILLHAHSIQTRAPMHRLTLKLLNISFRSTFEDLRRSISSNRRFCDGEYLAKDIKPRIFTPPKCFLKTPCSLSRRRSFFLADILLAVCEWTLTECPVFPTFWMPDKRRFFFHFRFPRGRI